MRTDSNSEGNKFYQNEDWYLELKREGQRVCKSIYKYHDYFSSQDKMYRNVVRVLKITMLALTMFSTIVLGLKTIINIDIQIVIGLVLSAIITFITAIASYFNFEEYWMRNIAIHIELNILRDNFVYDAESKKLSKKKIRHYKQQLEDIHRKNIYYWEKAISRISKI